MLKENSQTKPQIRTLHHDFASIFSKIEINEY